MKKHYILLIALMLILVLIPVSASEDDRLTVSFGTGNDYFTRGLSRDEDDFRTYGIYLNAFWKDYNFFADLDVFTFREQGYRYDILSIGASKKFVFDNFYIVNAGLGLQLKGPLAGEFFQNKLHEIRKIHPVYLTYDPGNIHFSARAQLRAFLNTTISPYIEARTGFDAFVAAGARLKTGKNSNLYLTYSYDIFGTHGLNFGMESDFGFLISTYYTNLLDHFGYGYIAINPFKPFNGTKNTITGLVMMTGSGLEYSVMEVRFSLKENLTAFLNIKSCTGELEHSETKRMEDNFYSIGAGYMLFDRLELRLFGGAHYREEREYQVIDSYLAAQFGADLRVKCIDAFNVSFNVDGGVIWCNGFYFFGGISILI